MKKSFIVTFLLFVLSGIAATAKDRLNDQPLYRSVGYMGSVSLTSNVVLFGLDTSHGYMFNEHHYLGGGVGIIAVPADNIPMFGRIYADYKVYFLKKNSTPAAGLQAGYCGALKNLSGNTFQNAFELDPHIGWNWTFSKGIGLDLSVGASVFLYNSDGGPSIKAKAAPKISIGIEF